MECEIYIISLQHRVEQMIVCLFQSTFLKYESVPLMVCSVLVLDISIHSSWSVTCLPFKGSGAAF